jgi:hypothetical protein
MAGNPNGHHEEFYWAGMGKSDFEELPDELPGHYAVDDGFCSCGVLCETGTGLRRHLAEVLRTPHRQSAERE